MGHEAELAAAALNETKELPHAAFIVSVAERIVVALSAEWDDKEAEKWLRSKPEHFEHVGLEVRGTLSSALSSHSVV
jgi:hypothetical protein